MNTRPLVSVLIPVYNAGDYLQASVGSILSQTYTNLEIIIIDDGSTDGCMDFMKGIKDSRISIITQSNSGKAGALNRALEQLSGEFYAIQDADDVSYPQRIERQVQCMQQNSELAAVFTGNDVILNSRRLAPLFSGKSVEDCRKGIEDLCIPAHDATPLYRVSMVKDIRYEPTLRIGQGVDYILRVGEHGCLMLTLDECLYTYRFYAGSTIMKDVSQRKQMIERVVERACERRGLKPNDYLPVGSKHVRRPGNGEKDLHMLSHFMESVLDLRSAGRIREALETALACLWLHPRDPYYYKPLAYFLAPLALIRYYRSRKAKTR